MTSPVQNFTDADVPSQVGRTFLVTGANTGLGFEAAKVLAGKGARVLLGCRSRPKAEEAVARIRAAHGDADVEIVDLDLGDLASVRRAAEVVLAEPQLDVLVNNAGVMVPPLGYTADGFETQLGVNHLGPFALTGLLLPKLRVTEGSRIVNTSSNAHKAGEIDFDDVRAERGYSSIGRYSMSKLANLLHTYELDRRLRAAGAPTLAVAAHPGGSTTDLMRHLPGPQGAWPTLAAATAPGVEGGQYFGPKGLFELAGPAKLVRSTARSRDLERARRLWDLSVELTGVDPAL